MGEGWHGKVTRLMNNSTNNANNIVILKLIRMGKYARTAWDLCKDCDRNEVWLQNNDYRPATITSLSTCRRAANSSRTNNQI